MSATLSIGNFGPGNVYEQSALAVAVAAADPTFTVDNANNFLAQLFVILGRPGSETSDFLRISSVAGVVITPASAPTHAHGRFDTVTVVRADQIKLYRAPNVNGTAPADAAFSYLTTLPLDTDQPTTYATDIGGSSDYWYKATYYNSASTAESPLANSTPTRGDNTIAYCTIADVRDEAGFNNNPNITDQQIDQKRQAARAFIHSQLSGLYTLPFTPPIDEGIRQINIVLAAGMLLKSEFGVNSVLADEGKEKVTWAEAQLSALKAKTSVIVGADGVSTAIPGAGGFSSWPDRTTATTDPSLGGGERKIRVSDRY